MSLRRFLAPNGCPDVQALAAYADRQLVGAERHQIERHLSSCDVCADQVAFLVHSAVVAESPVPDAQMATALRMGQPQTKQRIPSWGLAGACALALLVVLSAGLQYARRDKTERDATQVAALETTSHSHPNEASPVDKAPFPELRGSEAVQSPFVFPAPDQQVDVTNLVFRWKAVVGAETYDIELLADDGAYMWGGTVSTLSIALPKSVRLEQGRTYFIKLSIHLADGSIDHTRAIGFVAGE